MKLSISFFYLLSSFYLHLSSILYSSFLSPLLSTCMHYSPQNPKI